MAPASGAAIMLKPRLAQGTAVAACAAMAVLYVGILYLPQLLLRLPPARSINEHYIRRFLCSVVSSVLAAGGCVLLLPVTYRSLNLPSVLAIFGLRVDHLWQAILYPLLLTALLYLGPLVMVALDSMLDSDLDSSENEGKSAEGLVQSFFTKLVDDLRSLILNIYAWRNFVVGPVTEEWVFRGCMIPLLLCAGYSPLRVMLLCPLFFGAAHLHHYWEMVYSEKQDQSSAALITGFRFAYTTIFGWYAAFLYLRTGHLVAPLVAHVFCNIMGLPSVSDAFNHSHSKVIGISFIAGFGGFIYLLQQATSPALYNSDISSSTCRCWLGYCMWR